MIAELELALGFGTDMFVVRTSTSTPNNWIPIATMTAALISAVVATLSALLQRRTGKEAARAALRSAQASERSSRAAEAAVQVNAETSRVTAKAALADALMKRYQEAANQLASASSAVRIAGVHEFANLADGWPEQRQACLDVLCAYLRSPPGSGVGDTDDVQRRILRIMEEHLTSPETGWSDLEFDFTGATFADVVLDGWSFNRRVQFDRCRFAGKCWLRHFQFGGGVSFQHARIGGDFAVVAPTLKGDDDSYRVFDFSWATFVEGATCDIDLPFAPDVGPVGYLAGLHRLAIDGVVRFTIHKEPGELRMANVMATEIRIGSQGALAVQGAGLWNDTSRAFYASFPIVAAELAPGARLLVERGLTDRGVNVSGTQMIEGATVDTRWVPPIGSGSLV